MKKDLDFLKGIYIAHRGLYHNEKGIPENSIRAFKEAVKRNIPVELDVHLLKDGNIVVFHDDNLSRMTGYNKMIKDCTYEEISGLRLLDTNEKIPLFEEVLQVINGKVLIDIELKYDTERGKLETKLCSILDNYEGKFNMRKIGILFLAVITLFMTGCGAKEKNIEGSLTDIMAKVYEGIPEEELPMALSNIEVTKDTLANYVGTSDIDMKEALASESMVGSIAHSVVLIRMNEGADVAAAVTAIQENANPRKWICVEAENVYVERKGDLIILIMSGENADTLKTNFENLQ